MINRNNIKENNELKIKRSRFVDASFPQYHLDVLESLNDLYSLKNKIIIDIGGSNIPAEVMKLFEVNKFVCVDPVSKWGYHFDKNKCFNKRIYKQSNILKTFENEYSFVIDDDVENLDNSLFGKFDIAISISAFEHINSVSKTLVIIFKLLNSDGLFHTQYQPIFSCASGHHVFIDENYNFNNMPEINYIHLLYSKNEARKIINNIERFSDKIKKETIWQIYDDKKINRFSLNQHIEAIFNSEFKKYMLDFFCLQPVPDDIKLKLISKYDNIRFDVNGIKFTAFKQ